MVFHPTSKQALTNTNVLFPALIDYIIVGANKPAFFADGTTLREVNLETGALSISQISEFQKGHVYNGGSMQIFSQLSGAKVIKS
jgi:hypothetical protein